MPVRHDAGRIVPVPVRTSPPTWADARACAHRAAPPLPPVTLTLEASLGGVLAEPLRAAAAVPLVDTSAMDGYAVRGPSPWTVVAQVLAGQAVPAPLLPGTGCEIATGAPVPPSTSGVLPYEQAERAGGVVSGPAVPGRHIRRAGEECAAGEQVLPAGTLVTPATLGLAAALGHDTLTVHGLPRVLAVVTGDELLGSGMPAAGQVRDAIGPMLPGLVSWAGGRFDGAVRLAYSTELLAGAIRDAEAEVVLVSGSSSRGPADHLRPALDELGAELLVDGVACRPGHPQALARLRDGRLVVGLPGNPLAAFVAFLTLALPALTALRGLALPDLPPGPEFPGTDSTRLVPVQVRGDRVTQLPHAGSAMLRGLAGADALAVIAPTGASLLHPLPGPL